MAVKQYKEAGVCKTVNENTVDVTGSWIRATDVDKLDELMPDLAMFRYIISGTGAVLEAAGDGLRVGPAALGSALTGGGDTKIRVKISKEQVKAITDADKILFKDTNGALWWTTRLDVNSSGPIPGYTLVGNSSAGNAPQNPLGMVDFPAGTFSVGATAVGFEASGALRRFDLAEYLRSVNLGTTYSDVDIKVTNSAGQGIVLTQATTAQAGLMTKTDKTTLDALSASSTNLSTTYTTSTATIENTTGTSAIIAAATLTAAGVMSSNAARLVTKLAGGPANALFVNSTAVSEPDWATKASFTFLPLLSSTRLVGFDASGALGVFQPPTGGGTAPGISALLHITAHGRTSSDIGKPIDEQGQIYNDVAADSWPLSILKSVIDANTLEVTPPGFEAVFPGALFPPGYDPAVEGGYLFWDASAGVYVTPKPIDTVGDISEQITVTEADGAGNFYATVRDFGPLGASTVSSGGGGTPTPGEAEILLSNGVPQGTPAAGLKLAVDTANNDLYYASGSSWAELADAVITAPDGALSVNVLNVEVLILNYVTQAAVADLTNGRERQVLTIVTMDDKGTVADGPEIRLAHGDDFEPGIEGGTLTLIYVNGVRYERSRTSFTPLINIIAGSN